MADLSDARLKSIRERGEALKRWSEDEGLSLPEAIKETMRLSAEDIMELLDERERLIEKENGDGAKAHDERD